jgi:hypothetical protein
MFTQKYCRKKPAVTEYSGLHVCHASCLLRLVTYNAYKPDRINTVKAEFTNAPEDKYVVFISCLFALPWTQRKMTKLRVSYVGSYVIHSSCYLFYITFACLKRGKERESSSKIPLEIDTLKCLLLYLKRLSPLTFNGS